MQVPGVGPADEQDLLEHLGHVLDRLLDHADQLVLVVGVSRSPYRSNISTEDRIAVNGVRNSWEAIATKRDLSSLSSCSRAKAVRTSASASRKSASVLARFAASSVSATKLPIDSANPTVSGDQMRASPTCSRTPLRRPGRPSRPARRAAT